MNSNNQIIKVLRKKYGERITEKLVSSDGRAILNRVEGQGKDAQKEVFDLLNGLSDKSGENLIPKNFHLENNEWGVDFSSWFGFLHDKKKYMFIGAEPHIVNGNNYQFVYGFGCYESEGDSIEKSIEKSAIQHYSRNDIWKYVTNIFVDDLTCANIVAFLSKCYITDLCHIVPKGHGQVSGIIKKLNEKLDEEYKLRKTDWIKFRGKVSETFLIDEIKAVNPEYIILHGNAARIYFNNKIETKEVRVIADSKYKIIHGLIEIDGKKYPIISIPHLKGMMKTMLWENNERFKSARKIIREIIKLD